MKMDAERQPLLNPNRRETSDLRCRRFRPLTSEEVLNSRQEVTWRRARFVILLMFWAIMAMLLSSVACVLVVTPRCVPPSPVVPPVHLSLTPLVTRRWLEDTNNDAVWMA